MLTTLKLEWNGECCVTLKVTDQIEAQALTVIQGMIQELEALAWPWVTEWVPGYTGLTLYLDPMTMDLEQLNQWASHFVLAEVSALEAASQTIEIPVLYGGSYGPDLDKVATHADLSPEAVIERHTQSQCLIYMMGFLPGFAYMGGLDPELATPRLTEPRTRIEAGSVGIAGEQTGIYPLTSPGGWNIIGRTPLKLFDPHRQEPALLKAGMQVRFKAISEAEFIELSQKVGEAHV